MEKIIEELRSHESQLKSQLEELTGKAREISKTLSQVKAAITALIGSKPMPFKTTAMARSKSLDVNEIQQQLLAIVQSIWLYLKRRTLQPNRRMVTKSNAILLRFIS